MSKLWILMAFFAAAIMGSTGCGKSRELEIRAESGIDLSKRFSLANAAAPDNFQRHMKVIRKGKSKDALKLVAPVTIQASLNGTTGKRVLEFCGAPVFDTGDGFLMRVFVRRSGVRYPVGNKYFDPGTNAEDRSWISFAIQLGKINEGDQLEIEVSGGPQGDLTADWLALSSFRLREQ